MYEVLFYEDERGRCPVDEFLDGLTPKVLGKVEKWIVKLEQEGPDLPRPYADVVAGKVRELRVMFGSGHYRFLYFFWKEDYCDPRVRQKNRHGSGGRD